MSHIHASPRSLFEESELRNLLAGMRAAVGEYRRMADQVHAPAFAQLLADLNKYGRQCRDMVRSLQPENR